jgi:DNA-binding MarR family transcriptional regulator
MVMNDDLSLAVTHEVRDGCVCLHLQRAARALARRFDEAFRPLGITNGQFSILTSLNRPDRPRIGEVADLLAMDRTTLTAALKPLQRAGWVEVAVDPADARSRRMELTAAGREVVRLALPVWRQTHAELAQDHPTFELDQIRASLGQLSASSRLARRRSLSPG